MTRWAWLGALVLLASTPVLARDGAPTRPGARDSTRSRAASGTGSGATASSGEAGEDRRVAEPRRKVRVVLDGKVNVNTASVQMLDMLPGVGLKAAQRIVAQREKRPFRRPEELVKVKGFGRKKFQRIRPYVSVQGPTTLHPVWVGLGKEVEPSGGG